MIKVCAKTVGRLVALVIVTAFAGAVMWATGVRRVDDSVDVDESAEARVVPAAPVGVCSVTAAPVEILDTYAGMLRPFERYSVAFEVAGRLERLGQNARKLDLDEGDRVTRGQLLASLDPRILKARVDEASAVLEQAQQELDRARQMRSARNPAISETIFQTRVTELAVAQARVDTSQKNLEDAQLRSPCDGVISRRFVNSGESIATHQAAFEIVEVDRVLLVVGVPESRVQELEARRQVLRDASQGEQDVRPFRVHIALMSRDRYGVPRAELLGEVYRIGETADDKTGLFEVEILIDNADGELKPGLVAQARIVVDELTAFRIPIEAALFRGAMPYVYAVHERLEDLPAMFWNLGPQPDFFVRKVSLTRYIEQDGQLIVPEIEPTNRTIVIRGQHRLVDGRRVRIVSNSEIPASTALMTGPPNESLAR